MNYSGTIFLSDSDTSEDYYYYYYYQDYDYGEEYEDTFTGHGGATALHIAVREHSTKFVAKLVTVAGITVDPKDEHGYTPLYDAATMGFVKMISMLHSAGADIHAKDKHGDLPIHAAVASGYLQAVKILLQLGEGINVLGGYDNDSPLIHAVYYKQHDVAEYLVQHGADVNIRNNRNMAAMDYAVDNAMKQILKGSGSGSGSASMATESPQCRIHDTKYPYSKISDLGMAALDNDVDAVDDLIMKVG